MNRFAETLWDLVGLRQSGAGNRQSGKSRQEGIGNRQPEKKNRSGSSIAGSQAPIADSRIPVAARKPTMQQRYDALVAEMKRTYGIRIRKWRRSTTGCAWQVRYEDGTVVRLIESPYPRGPMSCAVFLHEVGHHAIGLRTYKPRCLEEFKAWQWSVQTMRAKGFNVTPAVEKRMAESLRYAVAKARRRGLKRLPAELMPYVQRAPHPGQDDASVHTCISD